MIVSFVKLWIRNMNSTPKYSFIIPVYNGAEVLSRSLNSILEQDFINFEVIVIDDGSTDNTFEICIRYQQRDDRVKLYRQSNGGVSVARNKGIDKSIGDYLFFMDADDCLHDSKVLFHVDQFITSHADCDIFQFQTFICNGEQKKPIKLITINTSVSINKYAKLKVARGEIWNYIFRKDIIDVNNLRFIDGLRISEDQAFVYSYLVYCKQIGVSFIPTYLYYNDNVVSATKKRFSIEDLRDHMIATHAIISHLDKKRESYRFICERVTMMEMYLLNICAQLDFYDVSYIKRHLQTGFRFLRNNKGLLIVAMKINFNFSLFLYKRFILKKI